jgi:transposase
MNPKIFAIALAIMPAVSYAADIASINFKSIKDDLRAYYFAKPENAEIKTQFDTLSQDEQKRMAEMQAAMAKGDVKKMIGKTGGMERYNLEKKIDSDIKKELYLIISGMGLKYELIYDSSESETVIFAKSQVDDITTTVKQAVIELGKKK